MEATIENKQSRKSAGAMPQEKPSRRMLKSWAKRIAGGEAATIPVFVGGAWSLQVLRGKKRTMQLDLK